MSFSLYYFFQLIVCMAFCSPVLLLCICYSPVLLTHIVTEGDPIRSSWLCWGNKYSCGWIMSQENIIELPSCATKLFIQVGHGDIVNKCGCRGLCRNCWRDPLGGLYIHKYNWPHTALHRYNVSQNWMFTDTTLSMYSSPVQVNIIPGEGWGLLPRCA